MLTKTQQITDKAREHNGCAVFSRALVLLTRASTGVVSNSFYPLSSIHYTSSQYTPTSPFRLCHRNQQSVLPPTEHASTTDRVLRPLGLVVYDRISSLPLNYADTSMSMYHVAANLSSNHCVSGYASTIAKVSGINNVFSFILIFFTSSFLIPKVNINKCRRLGLS